MQESLRMVTRRNSWPVMPFYIKGGARKKYVLNIPVIRTINKMYLVLLSLSFPSLRFSLKHNSRFYSQMSSAFSQTFLICLCFVSLEEEIQLSIFTLTAFVV